MHLCSLSDTQRKHGSRRVERERGRERRRDRETHLKFLPGVSEAFNTYSHINSTLRQCNHGNRHQDYVKERHTKDPKMLCLKQWQHGPERKRKKTGDRNKQGSKKESSKYIKAARARFAAPAESVYVCVVVLTAL